MGERYNGIVEVAGSIPAGSTISFKGLAAPGQALFPPSKHIVSTVARFRRHFAGMIQKHPDRSTGQVCAARAAVRSHSTKKPPAGLLIAKSARRRREIAMQTAGSRPDLMSTAVIATLPVTASGSLENPVLREGPPRRVTRQTRACRAARGRAGPGRRSAFGLERTAGRRLKRVAGFRWQIPNPLPSQTRVACPLHYLQVRLKTGEPQTTLV